MALTLEDALARFAQKHCGQCAAQLLEPGGSARNAAPCRR